MNSKIHDFSDKLQVLTDSFIKALPDRSLKIKALLQDYLTDNDPSHIEDLHKEIHSLTGSCATFGLARISDISREFESYLKDVINSSHNDADKLVDNLNGHIDLVCNEIDNAAAGSSKTRNSPATRGIDKYLKTEHKLTILAADKDTTIREYISLILSEEGHKVLTAEKGNDAIGIFNSYNPDIVITGVVFDDISGYDIAHIVKNNSTGFTPVIFITSLKDNDELVQCIEAGGDDFLAKPINPVLLHTRIAAMDRIRMIQQSLLQYQEKMEEELRFARHIFDSITNRNPAHLAGIHYWTRPSGHFSGDIFAYSSSSGSKLTLLFGDLTGHGLTAAIGAVPSTDIFYTMTMRGFPISKIASEINKKLHVLMPTGRFLACVLLEIDFESGKTHCINCSMPPVLLGNDDNSIYNAIKSENIALGILDHQTFKPVVTEIDNTDMRSVLIYSDGISEIRNSDDEMLGDDAIHEVIDGLPEKRRISAIQKKLVEFTSLSKADDDISVLSVDIESIKSSLAGEIIPS